MSVFAPNWYFFCVTVQYASFHLCWCSIVNAALITMCVEANTYEQNIVPIEDTPVPKPVILGPGFNNATDSIRKSGGGDGTCIV